MLRISASVGQRGTNRRADAVAIQAALNRIPAHLGGAAPALVEDGVVGPRTIGAIRGFQQKNAGLGQDGRIDPDRGTLGRMNQVLGHVPGTPTRFTDANLYRGSGPSPSDIKQDAFGDCYFVATLGAVARQNPAVIRRAIEYDDATQSFRVRLFDTTGAPRALVVTQAELHDNVRRRGGSYVDNTGKYERVWPAVLETAYAKMFDSNPADGLGEGYQHVVHGGWPADAMTAITGSAGREVRYVHHASLGVDGSVAVLGARVCVAMRQRKSVTLWSVPEKDSRGFWARLTGAPIPQDGLVDNHLYTVMKLTRARTRKDWDVTVRNPWGTNVGVGEGRDTRTATMTVSLLDLVKTGGLHAFQVSY